MKKISSKRLPMQDHEASGNACISDYYAGAFPANMIVTTLMAP